MGREIKRVPLDWKHPKKEYRRFKRGQYQMLVEFVPKYKWPYEEAVLAWTDARDLWNKNEHPCQGKEEMNTLYEEEHPEPDNYMPVWSEDECTGWCVYETVSSGTPVTPVFANPHDLIDYLVEHGDFWDQERRKDGCPIMPCAPWSREAATNFVLGSLGWAPSLIICYGGGVMRGTDYVEGA